MCKWMPFRSIEVSDFNFLQQHECLSVYPWMFNVPKCLKTIIIRAWNCCKQVVITSNSIWYLLLNEDFTCEFRIKSKSAKLVLGHIFFLRWNEIVFPGGPITWRLNCNALL